MRSPAASTRCTCHLRTISVVPDVLSTAFSSSSRGNRCQRWWQYQYLFDQSHVQSLCRSLASRLFLIQLAAPVATADTVLMIVRSCAGASFVRAPGVGCFSRHIRECLNYVISVISTPSFAHVGQRNEIVSAIIKEPSRSRLLIRCDFACSPSCRLRQPRELPLLSVHVRYRFVLVLVRPT